MASVLFLVAAIPISMYGAELPSKHILQLNISYIAEKKNHANVF